MVFITAEFGRSTVEPLEPLELISTLLLEGTSIAVAEDDITTELADSLLAKLSATDCAIEDATLILAADSASLAAILDANDASA